MIFLFIKMKMKNLFHSWFWFTIIIKNIKIIDRSKICDFLNKNGIETRVIVSGNFVSQPVVKNFPHRTLEN